MPENTHFLLLEAPFSPQKEPSKELEITGTETRTKLIYAESAQTLHTGMRLAHHPQVPQTGVPAKEKGGQTTIIFFVKLT